MQIGSFAELDQVSRLADAGADYVELFVIETVMLGDREDFDHLLRDAKRWPIPAIAFAGLIPGDLKICGPDVDRHRQDLYLTEMLDRIQLLAPDEGMATLGSADARHVPADFERRLARDQIADFLRRAHDQAAQRGIALNLEHLNPGESNIFNTLAEAGAFLAEYQLEGIGLLADLFHLMEAGEPIGVMRDFPDLIKHVHVADTDRDAPGTGAYPFDEFFATLQSIGYSGRCSIEAFWSDFERDVELGLRSTRLAAHSAGL